MEKTSVIWKIFGMYLLVLAILLLMSGNASGQMRVTQFNASWNSANEVPWVMGLEDCNTYSYIDIAKDTEAQAKYKIAVIPTIIIFKDGEEVARFQADLSFKMVATKEEVQEEIDNQLMSDF
jgi:thiol-disulfide isomerase/thioredoxin